MIRLEPRRGTHHQPTSPGRKKVDSPRTRRGVGTTSSLASPLSKTGMLVPASPAPFPSRYPRVAAILCRGNTRTSAVEVRAHVLLLLLLSRLRFSPHQRGSIRRPHEACRCLSARGTGRHTAGTFVSIFLRGNRPRSPLLCSLAHITSYPLRRRSRGRCFGQGPRVPCSSRLLASLGKRTVQLGGGKPGGKAVEGRRPHRVNSGLGILLPNRTGYQSGLLVLSWILSLP